MSHHNGQSTVHDILVRRLADNHNLPLITAHFAVRRVALGLTPDQYTPLVTAEAGALAREAVQQAHQLIAEFMRVLAPRLRAMSEAAMQVAASLRTAGLTDEDAKPRTGKARPAWQTPYGPAPRRKR
ncbi:hypothetical protein ACFUEN_29110 [Streptomyces griseorubiginosus]|uniref:hypothetical protein n=1 Tax=Streptomyces griseorubiginosus TaxID=67304 RepID=UPI00362E4F36